MQIIEENKTNLPASLLKGKIVKDKIITHASQ